MKRRHSNWVWVICFSLLTGNWLFADDWPFWRGNSANTGYANENIQLPLSLKWNTVAPKIEENGAVIGDGVAYITSENGEIFAIELATGATLPGFPVVMNTPNNFGSPGYGAGKVFAKHSGDGKLYAYDGKTGILVSGFPVQAGIAVSTYFCGPIMWNERVFVGGGDGKLYAFDVNTGDPAPGFPVSISNDEYGATPAIADSVVYCYTSDNKIYAYKAANGQPIPNFPVNVAALGKNFPDDQSPIIAPPQDDFDVERRYAAGSSPAIANGNIYVFAKDGQLWAFNAKTGAKLSGFPVATGGITGGWYGSPAVANEAVYLYCQNGGLYAFDALTGATMTGFPISLYPAGSRNYSFPIITNDLVFVGAGESKVFYVIGAAKTEQAGKIRWQYTMTTGDTQGFDLCSPAISDGVVYLMLDGGGLYAFYGSGTVWSGGALVINSGAQTTNSREVTLTINAGSNQNVVEMMISNDPNFGGASWEVYATSKAWILSQGEGVKTVYLKFRDSNSNVSSVYADDIVYGTTPGSITNLAADVGGEHTIHLSWTNPSDTDYAGTVIVRKTGGYPANIYDGVRVYEGQGTSFNDTDLIAGTTYYYSAFAYDTANLYSELGAGSTVSATTSGATNVPPPAPSALIANSISSSQINLTWIDNSSNESGFIIERRTTSAGMWGVLDGVAANVQSYESIGLSPATTYYYRVRAYNSYGNSGYSNEAGATTTAASGSRISGRVTDATTGIGIAGATVTLAGQTTTTDGDGNYSISNITASGVTVNFSGSPRSGKAPLTVEFNDQSSVGYQTISASATNYYDFETSIVIPAGGSVTYDVSLSPRMTAGQMRLVLNWGVSPQDLDIHLKTPIIEGISYEVYWNDDGSASTAPYALLDHDDTDGLGPETITIHQAFPGTYRCFVHNYSETPEITTSNAVIKIYGSTGIRETVNVPTIGSGLYWYICDIDGSSGAITIKNILQNCPPGAAAVASVMAKKKPKVLTEGHSSTVVIDRWEWDFENDGVIDATVQNPTHTYERPGSYTVKLTVYESTKSYSAVKENYIEVNPAVSVITRWTPQTSGFSQDLTSVFATDTLNAWVVGTSGATARTYNGGNIWEPRFTTSSRNLNDVFFINPWVGWTVGGEAKGNATILKSADMGVSWTEWPSSSTALLHANYMVTDQIGWNVGAQGKIEKTTDGGAVWVPQASGVTETLRSVYFANAENGWAAGDNGAILRTTNSGATWSKKNSGTTSRINQIQFDGLLHGIAVGAGGKMLYTSDGGETWYNSQLGEVSFNGVHFIDSYTGYVVGDAGTIYRYDYADENFVKMNSGTTANLRAVYLASPTCGWAVGDGGTILKLTADSAVPASVSDLVAYAVGANRISLSWRNPSDTDFAGTIIMRKTGSFPASISDGVAIYNGKGVSCSDSNLVANTTYYYTAFAYDLANLYSEIGPSSRVSATTFESSLTGYVVTISSLDAESFPRIKCFVAVVDATAKTSVTGLAAENLKLREEGVIESPITVEAIGTSSGAKADIVFVFDTTGSMGEEISGLKQRALQFADALAAKGIDYRLGLVTYSDVVEQVHELTADANEFKTWIDGLVAAGGGDTKENALEALARATRLGFRAISQKIAILITDAPYHQAGETGEGTTSYTTASMISLLRESSLVTNTVAIDELQFHQMADQTGGLFFNITGDFQSVVDNIGSILSSQYVISYTSHNPIPDSKWRNVTVSAEKSGKGGFASGKYYIGSAQLVMSPANILGMADATFTVEVRAQSIVDLGLCHFFINYDPTKVEATAANVGSFLAQGGASTPIFTPEFDKPNGKLEITTTRVGATTGASGSGVLCSVTFKVLTANCTSDLTFGSVDLRRPDNTALAVSAYGAHIGAASVSGLLGDFDKDLDIDTRDFALLSTYWKPANNALGDIGPASGIPPFLTPAPDAVVNFEDLFVFTRMWNWYHETSKATGGGALAKASPQLEWRLVSANAGHLTIELYALNVEQLAMAHLMIQYDAQALRSTSITPGALLKDGESSLAFFVDDNKAKGVIDIALSRLAQNRHSAEISGEGALLRLEFDQLNTLASGKVSVPLIDLRSATNEQLAAEEMAEFSIGASDTPKAYELLQNYPNPFNGRTEISFRLPEASDVRIQVVNVLGQPVRDLVKTHYEAGAHRVTWDGINDIGHEVVSGIYLVRMEAGAFRQTREILFLK